MSGRRVSDDEVRARILDIRRGELGISYHDALLDLRDIAAELATTQAALAEAESKLADETVLDSYARENQQLFDRAEAAEAALAEALAANAAAERRGMVRAAQIACDLRHPAGFSDESEDWCQGTADAAEAIRAALPSPSDAAPSASEVRA